MNDAIPCEHPKEVKWGCNACHRDNTDGWIKKVADLKAELKNANLGNERVTKLNKTSDSLLREQIIEIESLKAEVGRQKDYLSGKSLWRARAETAEARLSEIKYSSDPNKCMVTMTEYLALKATCEKLVSALDYYADPFSPTDNNGIIATDALKAYNKKKDGGQ